MISKQHFIFKKSALTALFLLVLSNLFANSPWVPKKGKGYALFSYTKINYSSGINSNELFKTVEDATLQPYFQFGLGNNWGITGFAPYKIVETNGPEGPDTTVSSDFVNVDNGRLSAFGNIGLELKKSKKIGSLQVGYSVEVTTPSFENDELRQLFTGYDAWGIKPTFSIGKGGNGGYTQGSIGYKWLSNNYVDLIQFSGEAATKLDLKPVNVFLAFAINGSIPVGDENLNDERSEQTLLYTNGAGYVSPGLKIIVQLPIGLEFTASGFGAFWAESAPSAGTGTIGIAYKW